LGVQAEDRAGPGIPVDGVSAVGRRAVKRVAGKPQAAVRIAAAASAVETMQCREGTAIDIDFKYVYLKF
jgi:hypothetical protein